jgi:hypothetical protein
MGLVSVRLRAYGRWMGPHLSLSLSLSLVSSSTTRSLLLAYLYILREENYYFMLS